MVASDRQPDQQRHERRRQRDRAEEVDVAPRRLVGHARERDHAHDHREDADGHVHVKDPPPAEVVGEVTADRRSDDRREAEDPAEHSLELRALRGRIEVADGREHAREEHAAEDALQRTKTDELGHVLCLATERRREDEADHARQHEGLAPEEVPELPGDRGQGGRGDEVAGGHPGVEVEAVELGHDARQGGADDRLVERREEQGQRDADGRQDPCPAGHLTGHWRSPSPWLRSRRARLQAQRAAARASRKTASRARERRAPSCTRGTGRAPAVLWE